MPIYTFLPEATKLRYKEPYVSEATNLKDSGIIPVGIYNGYTPTAVGAGADNLLIIVDPVRGDSIAVIETRTGKYNLTIRSSSNILLTDFSGVAFPALVVLRTEYAISPMTGTTVSEILVVDPTLNDADPTHLNTGDIRICRVTGDGGGLVTFTLVPGTDRNDTGGSLVTQNQVTSSLTQMAWKFEATPLYDAPSQTYSNTVISFTTAVTQDLEVDLQANLSAVSGGATGMYVAMVLDYVNPGNPGIVSQTQLGLGGWSLTIGMYYSAKMLFPSVAAGSHTLRMKYISSAGGSNPTNYLGIVHYK